MELFENLTTLPVALARQPEQLRDIGLVFHTTSPTFQHPVDVGRDRLVNVLSFFSGLTTASSDFVTQQACNRSSAQATTAAHDRTADQQLHDQQHVLFQQVCTAYVQRVARLRLHRSFASVAASAWAKKVQSERLRDFGADDAPLAVQQAPLSPDRVLASMAPLGVMKLSSLRSWPGALLRAGSVPKSVRTAAERYCNAAMQPSAEATSASPETALVLAMSSGMAPLIMHAVASALAASAQQAGGQDAGLQAALAALKQVREACERAAAINAEMQQLEMRRVAASKAAALALAEAALAGERVEAPAAAPAAASATSSVLTGASEGQADVFASTADPLARLPSLSAGSRAKTKLPAVRSKGPQAPGATKLPALSAASAKAAAPLLITGAHAAIRPGSDKPTRAAAFASAKQSRRKGEAAPGAGSGAGGELATFEADVDLAATELTDVGQVDIARSSASDADDAAQLALALQLDAEAASGGGAADRTGVHTAARQEALAAEAAAAAELAEKEVQLTCARDDISTACQELARAVRDSSGRAMSGRALLPAVQAMLTPASTDAEAEADAGAGASASATGTATGHVRRPFQWFEADDELRGASAHAASILGASRNVVYATGQSQYGECGMPNVASLHVPTRIIAMDGRCVTSIAAGNEHTVFSTAYGEALAVGYSASGQCGVTGSAPTITPLPPHKLQHGRVLSVNANNGCEHSFFVVKHGNSARVFGAGFNLRHQLGVSGPEGGPHPVPLPLDAEVEDLAGSVPRSPSINLPVHLIACSYYHSLFALRSGAVFGCGRADAGQLGRAASGEDVKVPTLLLPLHQPAYRAAVRLFGDVRLTATKPWWEGEEQHEERAEIAPRPTPWQQGEQDSDSDSSSSGDEATSRILRAMRRSRTASVATVTTLPPSLLEAMADGDTQSRQQAEAAQQTPEARAPPAGGNWVRSIAAGQHHSVIVLSDGRVFSAGRGDWGATGLPNGGCTRTFTLVDSGDLAPPVDVWHEKRRDALAKAKQRARAAVAAGCTPPEPPLLPSTLVPRPILAVACGYYHTLLQAADGGLLAFGRNDSGMTGNGIASSKVAVPKEVALPRESAGASASASGGHAAAGEVVAIAAGCYHSVAVVGVGREQRVYAFGRNQMGQCGVGDSVERTSPSLVDIPGLGQPAPPVPALLRAAFSSQASDVPDTVEEVMNVKSIAAGFYHTVFLLGPVPVSPRPIDRKQQPVALDTSAAQLPQQLQQLVDTQHLNTAHAAYALLSLLGSTAAAEATSPIGVLASENMVSAEVAAHLLQPHKYAPWLPATVQQDAPSVGLPRAALQQLPPVRVGSSQHTADSSALDLLQLTPSRRTLSRVDTAATVSPAATPARSSLPISVPVSPSHLALGLRDSAPSSPGRSAWHPRGLGAAAAAAATAEADGTLIPAPGERKARLPPLSRASTTDDADGSALNAAAAAAATAEGNAGAAATAEPAQEPLPLAVIRAARSTAAGLDSIARAFHDARAAASPFLRGLPALTVHAGDAASACLHATMRSIHHLKRQAATHQAVLAALSASLVAELQSVTVDSVVVEQLQRLQQVEQVSLDMCSSAVAGAYAVAAHCVRLFLTCGQGSEIAKEMELLRIQLRSGILPSVVSVPDVTLQNLVSSCRPWSWAAMAVSRSDDACAHLGAVGQDYAYLDGEANASCMTITEPGDIARLVLAAGLVLADAALDTSARTATRAWSAAAGALVSMADLLVTGPGEAGSILCELLTQLSSQSAAETRVAVLTALVDPLCSALCSPRMAAAVDQLLLESTDTSTVVQQHVTLFTTLWELQQLREQHADAGGIDVCAGPAQLLLYLFRSLSAAAVVPQPVMAAPMNVEQLDANGMSSEAAASVYGPLHVSVPVDVRSEELSWWSRAGARLKSDAAILLEPVTKAGLAAAGTYIQSVAAMPPANRPASWLLDTFAPMLLLGAAAVCRTEPRMAQALSQPLRTVIATVRPHVHEDEHLQRIEAFAAAALGAVLRTSLPAPDVLHSSVEDRAAVQPRATSAGAAGMIMRLHQFTGCTHSVRVQLASQGLDASAFAAASSEREDDVKLSRLVTSFLPLPDADERIAPALMLTRAWLHAVPFAGGLRPEAVARLHLSAYAGAGIGGSSGATPRWVESMLELLQGKIGAAPFLEALSAHVCRVQPAYRGALLQGKAGTGQRVARSNGWRATLWAGTPIVVVASSDAEALAAVERAMLCALILLTGCQELLPGVMKRKAGADAHAAAHLPACFLHAASLAGAFRCLCATIRQQWMAASASMPSAGSMGAPTFTTLCDGMWRRLIASLDFQGAPYWCPARLLSHSVTSTSSTRKRWRKACIVVLAAVRLHMLGRSASAAGLGLGGGGGDIVRVKDDAAAEALAAYSLSAIPAALNVCDESGTATLSVAMQAWLATLPRVLRQCLQGKSLAPGPDYIRAAAAAAAHVANQRVQTLKLVNEALAEASMVSSGTWMRDISRALQDCAAQTDVLAPADRLPFVNGIVQPPAPASATLLSMLPTVLFASELLQHCVALLNQLPALLQLPVAAPDAPCHVSSVLHIGHDLTCVVLNALRTSAQYMVPVRLCVAAVIQWLRCLSDAGRALRPSCQSYAADALHATVALLSNMLRQHAFGAYATSAFVAWLQSTVLSHWAPLAVETAGSLVTAAPAPPPEAAAGMLVTQPIRVRQLQPRSHASLPASCTGSLLAWPSAGDLTMCGWVRLDSSSSGQARLIFSAGAAPDAERGLLSSKAANVSLGTTAQGRRLLLQVRLPRDSGEPQVIALTSRAELAVERWTHVAFTLDYHNTPAPTDQSTGRTLVLRLYVAGALAAHRRVNAPASRPPPTPVHPVLHIGCILADPATKPDTAAEAVGDEAASNIYRGVEGWLSEVRLVSKALAPEEVAQLAAAGRGGTQQATVDSTSAAAAAATAMATLTCAARMPAVATELARAGLVDQLMEHSVRRKQPLPAEIESAMLQAIALIAPCLQPDKLLSNVLALVKAAAGLLWPLSSVSGSHATAAAGTSTAAARGTAHRIIQLLHQLVADRNSHAAREAFVTVFRQAVDVLVSDPAALQSLAAAQSVSVMPRQLREAGVAGHLQRLAADRIVAATAHMGDHEVSPACYDKLAVVDVCCLVLGGSIGEVHAGLPAVTTVASLQTALPTASASGVPMSRFINVNSPWAPYITSPVTVAQELSSATPVTVSVLSIAAADHCPPTATVSVESVDSTGTADTPHADMDGYLQRLTLLSSSMTGSGLTERVVSLLRGRSLTDAEKTEVATLPDAAGLRHRGPCIVEIPVSRMFPATSKSSLLLCGKAAVESMTLLCRTLLQEQEPAPATQVGQQHQSTPTAVSAVPLHLLATVRAALLRDAVFTLCSCTFWLSQMPKQEQALWWEAAPADLLLRLATCRILLPGHVSLLDATAHARALVLRIDELLRDGSSWAASVRADDAALTAALALSAAPPAPGASSAGNTAAATGAVAVISSALGVQQDASRARLSSEAGASDEEWWQAFTARSRGATDAADSDATSSISSSDDADSGSGGDADEGAAEEAIPTEAAAAESGFAPADGEEGQIHSAAASDAGAPPAPAADAINEVDVAQLEAMGFDRSWCVVALRLVGDVAAASSFIVDNLDALTAVGSAPPEVIIEALGFEAGDGAAEPGAAVHIDPDGAEGEEAEADLDGEVELPVPSSGGHKWSARGAQQRRMRAWYTSADKPGQLLCAYGDAVLPVVRARNAVYSHRALSRDELAVSGRAGSGQQHATADRPRHISADPTVLAGLDVLDDDPFPRDAIIFSFHECGSGWASSEAALASRIAYDPAAAAPLLCPGSPTAVAPRAVDATAGRQERGLAQQGAGGVVESAAVPPRTSRSAASGDGGGGGGGAGAGAGAAASGGGRGSGAEESAAAADAAMERSCGRESGASEADALAQDGSGERFDGILRDGQVVLHSRVRERRGGRGAQAGDAESRAETPQGSSNDGTGGGLHLLFPASSNVFDVLSDGASAAETPSGAAWVQWCQRAVNQHAERIARSIQDTLAVVTYATLGPGMIAADRGPRLDAGVPLEDASDGLDSAAAAAREPLAVGLGVASSGMTAGTRSWLLLERAALTRLLVLDATQLLCVDMLAAHAATSHVAAVLAARMAVVSMCSLLTTDSNAAAAVADRVPVSMLLTAVRSLGFRHSAVQSMLPSPLSSCLLFGSSRVAINPSMLHVASLRTSVSTMLKRSAADPTMSNKLVMRLAGLGVEHLLSAASSAVSDAIRVEAWGRRGGWDADPVPQEGAATSVEFGAWCLQHALALDGPSCSRLLTSPVLFQQALALTRAANIAVRAHAASFTTCLARAVMRATSKPAWLPTSDMRELVRKCEAGLESGVRALRDLELAYGRVVHHSRTLLNLIDAAVTLHQLHSYLIKATAVATADPAAVAQIAVEQVHSDCIQLAVNAAATLGLELQVRVATTKAHQQDHADRYVDDAGERDDGTSVPDAQDACLSSSTASALQVHLQDGWQVVWRSGPSAAPLRRVSLHHCQPETLYFFRCRAIAPSSAWSEIIAVRTERCTLPLTFDQHAAGQGIMILTSSGDAPSGPPSVVMGKLPTEHMLSTAKYLGADAWSLVRATSGFCSGLNRWQVRVERTSSAYLFIGVATADANPNHFLGSDEYGWGFLGDRALYHNHSKVASYGRRFTAGDTVGVELDCEAGTLAFWVNGQYLGVAFHNVSGFLYPAVAFYSHGQRVTLVSSMSWTPGMRLPHPGLSLLVGSGVVIPELAALMQLCSALSDRAGELPEAATTSFAWRRFVLWRGGFLRRRTALAGSDVTLRTDPAAMAAYGGGLLPGTRVLTDRGAAEVMGVAGQRLWLLHEEDSGVSQSGSKRVWYSDRVLQRPGAPNDAQAWLTASDEHAAGPAAAAAASDESEQDPVHLVRTLRSQHVGQPVQGSSPDVDSAASDTGHIHNSSNDGVLVVLATAAEAAVSVQEALRAGSLVGAAVAGEGGGWESEGARHHLHQDEEESKDSERKTADGGEKESKFADDEEVAALQLVRTAALFQRLAFDQAVLAAVGWKPLSDDAVLAAVLNELADSTGRNHFNVLPTTLLKVVRQRWELRSWHPPTGAAAGLPSLLAAAGLPSSTSALILRLAVAACRMSFIRLLNEHIRCCTRLIDFSEALLGPTVTQANEDADLRPDMPTMCLPYMARALHSCRGLFFSSVMRDMGATVLGCTATIPQQREDEFDAPADLPQITLNRPRAINVAIPSDDAAVRLNGSVFGQACRALHPFSGPTLRSAFYHAMDDGQARAFRVVFAGEAADDYSGLYRETFSHICGELQTVAWLHAHTAARVAEDDPDARLLCVLPLLCPVNGGAQTGAPQLFTLLPDAVGLLTDPSRESAYAFLGQLLGMALRTNVQLDLRLTRRVWSALVGDAANEEDLLELDVDLMHTLTAVEKAAQQALASGAVATDAVPGYEDLTWSVTLSSGHSVQLRSPSGVEGGVVSIGDLVSGAYRRAVVDCRLHESAKSLAALQRGFYSVIPPSFLPMLTPDALQAAICGTDNIDIELLRSNTDYDEGISPDDPHVQALWKVLAGFSQQERALFLRFVWGRSRLPATAAEFSMRFRIQAANLPEVAALPSPSGSAAGGASGRVTPSSLIGAQAAPMSYFYASGSADAALGGAASSSSSAAARRPPRPASGSANNNADVAAIAAPFLVAALPSRGSDVDGGVPSGSNSRSESPFMPSHLRLPTPTAGGAGRALLEEASPAVVSPHLPVSPALFAAMPQSVRNVVLSAAAARPGTPAAASAAASSSPRGDLPLPNGQPDFSGAVPAPVRRSQSGIRVGTPADAVRPATASAASALASARPATSSSMTRGLSVRGFALSPTAAAASGGAGGTTFALPEHIPPARAPTVGGGAAAAAALRSQQQLIDGSLPTSHTCFFSLHLPRYSSDTVLRRQLLYAIHNCLALDADYRLADEEAGGAWTLS